MNGPFGSLFMQQALLDLFVGDSLSYKEPTRTQTVRAVMFGVSLLVWVPVFVPAYALAGAWTATAIFLVTGSISALGLFAFRWGVSPRAVRIGLMFLFWGTIVGVAFVSGGIEAPALLWLPAVPIIAVLLIGPPAGLRWLILSCGTAIAFFFAHQNGVTIRQEVHGAILLWLHLASLCGIIICATTLTIVFKQSEAAVQGHLKEALHRADAGSRAKSEFLTKMSHELRTPINGIVGMVELALTNEVNPEQRGYLQSAKEAAEGLARIVDNVLSVAEGDSAPIVLQQTKFHVRDFVTRTMESSSCQVDSTKLKVSTIVAPGVPEMVVGDRDRLAQVLGNLIDNGLKFTNQGEVTVTVDVISRQRDSLELRFSVCDTGIGIAKDQQERMFEMFAQADSSTSRSYGGAGLGLTIAKSLVNQMKGQIWLDSEPDQGTTVTFTVPVTLDRTAISLRKEPSDQVVEANLGLKPGLRILVVDDNRVNQILMRGLLEKLGCEISIASDGPDAISRTDREAFDLVLMDIEMPGMDGFETTARIRLREAGTNSRIPIIAFTANIVAGYERRCREADMDGYLGKPIQLKDLVDVLFRCGFSDAPIASTPE